MTDEQFPDLEIGESLGRGSAGEVFRVREKSTGREGAFKRFSPMSIDRRFLERNFRRFDRMPGHAGIVPVPRFRFDETPYFVFMDLAQGKTLASRLPQGESLAWEWIRQVAEAMGHAHKHGVVHGNLHPGNIFVDGDESGARLSVADFGTGMVGDVHHIYLDENTYFAPPEQLECGGCRWSDGAAQRWDVYRFGAIAFYLVNRELPRGRRYFKERERLIAKNGGRPVPVDPEAFARIVRETPGYRWKDKAGGCAEIERYRAIIDACLAIDPEERPVDLREVRNRFREMDQERALREGMEQLDAERRRQRAKLAGARVVSIVLGMSFVAATYFLFDYLEKTHDFRNKVSELDRVVTDQRAHINQLDERWEETVSDLKQSREAADVFFSQVAQGTNAGGTGVASMRAEDLEDSRDYYRRILAGSGGGEESLIEAARARHSLAHIERKMGNTETALDQFRLAIEALDAVLTNRRGGTEAVTDSLRRLGDCHENIGSLLANPIGEEAVVHLAEAVRYFGEVLERNPNDTALVLRQAGTSFLYGNALHAHKRYNDAIAVYAHAADLADGLGESSPDSGVPNELIGKLQFRVAKALRGADRPGEAIDAHIAAMESIERVKDVRGFTPLQSLQMAESYLELGELFSMSDAEPADLDQVYNEALRLLAPLRNENPEDVEVAILHCRSLQHLGAIEREAGQWSEGFRLSVRGIEALDEAVNRNPDHLEGRLALAEARLGHLLFLENESDKAKDVAEKGVEAAESVLSTLESGNSVPEPLRSRYHERLESLFRRFGDAFARLGEAGPADRCYAQAAESLSYLETQGRDRNSDPLVQ